jgi:hypothetical protein
LNQTLDLFVLDLRAVVGRLLQATAVEVHQVVLDFCIIGFAAGDWLDVLLQESCYASTSEAPLALCFDNVFAKSDPV